MEDSAAATILNLERAGPLCGPVLQSAFRSLRLPPGSRGIDIGCGIGLSTMLLAEATQPGGAVTGVDIFDEVLEHARARTRNHPLAGSISFQQGDMHSLPFERNAFDWACSVDCVGYPAGDFPAVLKELTRIVRPGGRIALLAWSSQQLLPGHTMLEARLNAHCSASRRYLESQPPESHFLRALHWFPASGISRPECSTFVGQLQAPLPPETKTAVASLFEMLWADSLSNASERDAELYRELCSADSPHCILDAPEYCGFFTYTLFTGVVDSGHEPTTPR